MALVWRDIARSIPYAANDMIDAIKGKAIQYARFPMMGLSREALAPGLRSFVEEPYVVFYRPSVTGIVVLRVLHGARHLNKDLFP
ncbi:MAG: Toxin ParE3 [Pseudomonadota bacterium]|jgi:toxin ParE1/3/4